MPLTSIAELQDFLDREIPAIAGDYRVEEAGEGRVALRLLTQDKHLRPGPTVSGPNLFAIADFAAWLAVQTRIGPAPMAVTTGASIDFLRMPGGAGLTGRAEILKIGRSLAVIEVRIFADGVADPAARATLTFSLPKTAQKVGVK